jgi:hypothetical protein
VRNGYGNLTQALLQMGGPSQAQTQVDLMGAQRDMQLAQSLMQQQYVPNSGPLGAVSMLLGGLAGRKVQRGADERFSDALERQFAIEREQYARALEAQQAQEERAYQRDVQKIREREKAERDFAGPTVKTVGRDLVQVGPDGAQVLYQGQPDPRAPSEIEQRLAVARQMGATPEQLRALVLGSSATTNVPSGYRPTESGLEAIPGGPADPSVQQTKFSPKAIENARGKMQAITALKQQLGRVRGSFDNIKGTLSAGKLQGWLPTEGGEQFDKDVASLSPFIRQLTRTPGEGAMSDYESRLAQAINPDRGNYEGVTENQLATIEDLINVLELGYQDMLGGQQRAPRLPGLAPGPADFGKPYNAEGRTRIKL